MGNLYKLISCWFIILMKRDTLMKRTLLLPSSILLLVSLMIASDVRASGDLLESILDSNESYREDLGTVGYVFESVARLQASPSTPEPCGLRRGVVIGDGFNSRTRSRTVHCERLDSRATHSTAIVLGDRALVQKYASANWVEHRFPAPDRLEDWAQLAGTLGIYAADHHSVGFRLPSPSFPLGSKAETLAEEIHRRETEGWTVTATQTSASSATIRMSHPTLQSIYIEMDRYEYYVPSLVLVYDDQGQVRQRVELSYETVSGANGHVVPVCIYANFELLSPEIAAQGGNPIKSSYTLTVSDYEFITDPSGIGTGVYAIEGPQAVEVIPATKFNAINPH